MRQKLFSLKLFIVALVFFGLAFPVAAMRDLYTRSDHTVLFRTELRPMTSGDIEVTETIVQDFGAYERHGIKRIIPMVITDEKGVSRAFPVTNLVVSAGPGTPAQANVSMIGSEAVITIGDPAVTVSGPHTYQLRYTLGAAMTPSGDKVLLDIQAFDSWEQAIDRAEMVVYHSSRPLSEKCAYVSVNPEPCGSIVPGATETLAVQTGVDALDEFAIQLEFSAKDFVGVAAAISGAGYTAVAPVVIKTEVLNAVAVDPVKLRIPPVLYFNIVVTLVLVLFGIRRRRRRIRSVLSFSPETLGATFSQDRVPRLGGDVSVQVDPYADPPLEYIPPMGLGPAQVALLADQPNPTTCFSATIVDLAARNVVELDELNNGVWQISLKNAPSVQLRGYEQVLISRLFAEGPVLVLRETKLQKIAEELLQSVRVSCVEAGFLASGTINRKALIMVGDRPASWKGVLAFLSLIPLVFFMFTYFELFFFFIAYLVLRASFSPGAGRIPRGLSEFGAASRFRVRGFVAFLKDSEAARARLAADTGLWREYAGHVVALDLVKEWATVFTQIPNEQSTTWIRDAGRRESLFNAVNASASSASSGSSSGSSSRSSSSRGGGGGGGSW
jgi:uncharacterized membrane protein YgcG